MTLSCFISSLSKSTSKTKMANSLASMLSFSSPSPVLSSQTQTQRPKLSTFFTSNHPLKPFRPFPFCSIPSHKPPKNMPITTTSAAATDLGLIQKAIQIIQTSPPTWQSALLSNLVIFVLGTPILVSGLSISGIVAAFLLGSLTWRAFGPSGFLFVAAYFVIVSQNRILFRFYKNTFSDSNW